MKKIFILLMIFALTSGCSKKNAERSKTLNIALTSEISSLDPVNSYDNVSGYIIYNIYEQLYEYHYLNRPFELRPLLAESMPTIENQGKKYIIKIRKGVQYHDHPAFHGKPRFVNAYDFITAFKRLSYNPLNSTGWWLVDGIVVGVNDFKKVVGNDFEKFKSTPIKGVSAPNENTLIIELVSPSPQFIYKLAMSFLSPIPLEVIEYEKNDLGRHLVGTGPFYLSKIDEKKVISLSKFQHYHETFYPVEGDRFANNRGLLKDAGEKIPFIEGVNFKIVKENVERWNMFMKKELDLIVLPQDYYNQTFDEVGNLKEDIKSKNIRLQTMPTLTYWWLSFNMKDPLLGKNLNLRKAVAHAINMDKYIEKFTANTGQRANSILPPGIFGYDTNSTLPYSYDLNKAKDYLTKAGYPNGKNLPEIAYDTRAESNISIEQAEFFKEELAKIGIKVKVIVNNFNAFLEKSRTGHLQFFQDGWTLDYPDSENVFQLLIPANYPPGPNASYFNNKNFFSAYEKLSQLQDGDEKKALIGKLEKIVNDELPWVMQYYSRNFILYHDEVKNYRPSDLVWSFPKYIKLK